MHCSEITCLKGNGTTMITNIMDKVDKLASYFSCLPNLPPTNTASVMLRSVDTFFQFAEEEVLKAQCSLDATGISAWLLWMSAPATSKILTILFKASLKVGQFPWEWRKANVSYSSAKTWRQWTGYKISSSVYYSNSIQSVQITYPSAAISNYLDSNS